MSGKLSFFHGILHSSLSSVGFAWGLGSNSHSVVCDGTICGAMVFNVLYAVVRFFANGDLFFVLGACFCLLCIGCSLDAWFHLIWLVARVHVCSLDLLVVAWYAPSAARVLAVFCGESVIGVGEELLLGDGSCPVSVVSSVF